jgi:DNA-binding response OmpR family regulator
MSRQLYPDPVSNLNHSDDENLKSLIELNDQAGASLVVLVGAAGDCEDVLRAARDIGSGIIIAPNTKTALGWLRMSLVQLAVELASNVRPSADLVVDLQMHQARWRGANLALTALELRLLAALAERPRTWTFADLSDTVWGSSHHGDRSMIRSAVQRLRRKLDSAEVGVRIVSVRGIGFRLLVQASGSRRLGQGDEGQNRPQRPRTVLRSERVLHPEFPVHRRDRN